MANIFLSYARDDLPTAKRLAGALQAAGHSVWWDQHIGAGSRFSKEIDAALRASDLVVVLWSRSSIESTWVQDEAAFGRDCGRLLPVTIDEVEPPLGFRQFQAMSVARTARKLDAFLAAVAQRLGEPMPAPRPKAGSPTDGSALWRWVSIAAVIMAVLVGLSILLRDRAENMLNVVAVAAADGTDHRSQELARTIAVDLGRFRAGPLRSLTILGSDQRGAGGADYRVEVGVSGTRDNVRADVSLLSPRDSRILWTTTAEGPANELVNLRQRVGAMLGDVLGCAVEVASESRKLTPEVLGLYLDGCGRMSDLYASAPDQEVLSIFRQITTKAPDFAPGWANLALIEAASYPGTEPPDRPALRKALFTHLERAKQLGPNLPATIALVADTHPDDGTKPAHALPVLDRGLKLHPDSALLHSMRGDILRNLGRLNEGVNAAERAVALNPLSPGIRDSYISALAYGGRIGAAYAELKKAEAIWPGSRVLRDTRYRLDLRYGDPEAAKRQLVERGAGDLRPVPGDTAWLAFLDARINPSPANVERALDGFRARYRSGHGHIASYLQALGTFGRVEEAYKVVWSPVALDTLMAGTEALFRPHNRSIRADRRFIALAAKLGLVAYWEKSGIWPDFCREPQLPYDCKKEAASLTPEQRRLAKFLIG
jgi:tetratricopeptide (TPR) repeat protein